MSGIDEYDALLTLLFTMPGSVCIYYGTEIAMEGGYDPDCRRCMPWNEIERGDYASQISFMKELINLRKTQPLMRERNFHFPAEYENPRVIQFEKIGWSEKLEVLVNASDTSVELLHPQQGEILFSRNLHTTKLAPGGVCIRYIENAK